jgi:hypothetical protein
MVSFLTLSTADQPSRLDNANVAVLEGATVWRWELSSGEAAPFHSSDVSTRDKLSAKLDTMPEGELLLRRDGVAFPPGGLSQASG